VIYKGSPVWLQFHWPRARLGSIKWGKEDRQVCAKRSEGAKGEKGMKGHEAKKDEGQNDGL
jgi:hypothetical protein